MRGFLLVLLVIVALQVLAWGIGKVMTAIVAARETRRHERLRSGCCPECGYDMRTTPARCPECGRVPPHGLRLPLEAWFAGEVRKVVDATPEETDAQRRGGAG